MLTVADIIRIIEDHAPPELAVPRDPIGLQCGSGQWEIKKLMIALDADHRTISQAAYAGAGMLVAHHPLIYEPLASIDPESSVGRAVAHSLENKVAVYCAHTNLDAARNGMNNALAVLLGVAGRTVMASSSPERFKITVFVPENFLGEVRTAAFEAGAGKIGAYTRCSFTSYGTGTFMGSEGTDPAAGNPGSFEEVSELRFEVIANRHVVDGVIDAIRGVHPYEEPAIDIYSLHSTGTDEGIGIIGSLPEKTTVGKLANTLIDLLGAGAVTIIGDESRKVQRVAICSGSGASLIGIASASGTDVYLTGDMKYHDARQAGELDLAVIDFGHFAPERYGMKEFGKTLNMALRNTGADIEMLYAEEEDPFKVITRT